MILNRDAILAAADIQKQLVHVPEWGGDIYVKGLTGSERDKFEAGILELHGTEQKVNLVNIRAKLCAFSICDEGGKRLFTEEDIAALSKKSAAALTRVFAVAQKLSGLGDAEVAELSEGVKVPFDGSVSD